MPITPAHLWDAVDRIGSEDGTSAEIQPAVIAKLIEMKIVRLSANGLPQLSAYGCECYIIMQSGGGGVPELDNYGS